jgi:2'-5' RNA ligase
MPRLFTGLEVPEDITRQLELLRGGIPNARWIAPEDYHITLRFIGDIDEATARHIAELLLEVRLPAFQLKLAGIDWFGGPRPHSVHARVIPTKELNALQQAHERICQRAGLKPENRRFIPHVTIARCRGAPLAAVREYASAHGLFSAGPFDVNRFVLYSARPSRGGGPYVVEQAYPLLQEQGEG